MLCTTNWPKNWKKKNVFFFYIDASNTFTFFSVFFSFADGIREAIDSIKENRNAVEQFSMRKIENNKIFICRNGQLAFLGYIRRVPLIPFCARGGGFRMFFIQF